ncbi:hypothetical protein GCM10010282_30040 [Streptomyces roseolus]|nr:hypothetical protein GCM10010282_30040 [Streptomyces roseolus]
MSGIRLADVMGVGLRQIEEHRDGVACRASFDHVLQRLVKGGEASVRGMGRIGDDVAFGVLGDLGAAGESDQRSAARPKAASTAPRPSGVRGSVVRAGRRMTAGSPSG